MKKRRRCGTELDQWDYYRPSTKLMKGNVFSHDCLKFCPHEGGSHVTITYDKISQSQVTKGPP